jgi:hypothetical protein
VTYQLFIVSQTKKSSANNNNKVAFGYCYEIERIDTVKTKYIWLKRQRKK